MKDILAEIVAHKRGEVAQAKQLRPETSLRKLLEAAPPVRSFATALDQQQPIHLIAEIKKASPSAGLIRADLDPVLIARTYEAHGANCISVLTDSKYFQGSLEFLTRVRESVSLPILRKDFIIDPYQVVEARVAGADAILLIAECLEDCQLRELFFLADELGMDSLVEVHDEQNLDRVLKLDPPIVGVNNRNLKEMVTDLNHSLRLRSRVPQSTIFVSESGIRTRADVERLIEAGVNAILVGESLMKSPDIGQQIDLLLGAEAH